MQVYRPYSQDPGGPMVEGILSKMPGHRTVADVMTRQVHIATPMTPLNLLVRLLEENRISGVPIVDLRGMPVGVVSESDLMHHSERQQGKENPEIVASDVMTWPAITVQVKATVTDAWRIMQERDIRRLLVVDARGRIAGILSRRDLLQAFRRTDAHHLT